MPLRGASETLQSGTSEDQADLTAGLKTLNLTEVNKENNVTLNRCFFDGCNYQTPCSDDSAAAAACTPQQPLLSACLEPHVSTTHLLQLGAFLGEHEAIRKLTSQDTYVPILGYEGSFLGPTDDINVEQGLAALLAAAKSPASLAAAAASARGVSPQ